jgi:hypothetical protein
LGLLGNEQGFEHLPVFWLRGQSRGGVVDLGRRRGEQRHHLAGEEVLSDRPSLHV